MSGGVDSSVAAALLVRAGYEVMGAFMKQWSDAVNPIGVCQWRQDRRDALRVASRLGIPLLTLDFEADYRQRVIDYMFAEYAKGRTPNPDVLCNKYIKFGAWLEKAQKMGFEYLATGHYASIGVQSTKYRATDKMLTTLHSLFVARDKNKDQTYFLHQLSQEQLAHALFPIGHLLKSEVRSLARQFHLPTAEREESMGICFVGEVPMKEFLQQKIKPKPGDVVVLRPGSGLTDVISQHEGLAFYTIGQRHFGLQQSATIKKPKSEVRSQKSEVRSPNTQPLYVVGKNLKKNEIIVGAEDDPLLHKKEVSVGGVHWISGRAPRFPLHCEVRLRHRQSLQKAMIRLQQSDHSNQSEVRPARPPCHVVAGRSISAGGSPKAEVQFITPQRAPTPGQFAVFYRKGECLGGGVIL